MPASTVHLACVLAELLCLQGEGALGMLCTLFMSLMSSPNSLLTGRGCPCTQCFLLHTCAAQPLHVQGEAADTASQAVEALEAAQAASEALQQSPGSGDSEEATPTGSDGPEALPQGQEEAPSTAQSAAWLTTDELQEQLTEDGLGQQQSTGTVRPVATAASPAELLFRNDLSQAGASWEEDADTSGSQAGANLMRDDESQAEPSWDEQAGLADPLGSEAGGALGQGSQEGSSDAASPPVAVPAPVEAVQDATMPGPEPDAAEAEAATLEPAAAPAASDMPSWDEDEPAADTWHEDFLEPQGGANGLAELSAPEPAGLEEATAEPAAAEEAAPMAAAVLKTAATAADQAGAAEPAGATIELAATAVTKAAAQSAEATEEQDALVTEAAAQSPEAAEEHAATSAQREAAAGSGQGLWAAGQQAQSGAGTPTGDIPDGVGFAAFSESPDAPPAQVVEASLPASDSAAATSPDGLQQAGSEAGFHQQQAQSAQSAVGFAHDQPAAHDALAAEVEPLQSAAETDAAAESTQPDPRLGIPLASGEILFTFEEEVSQDSCAQARHNTAEVLE